ncbi:MAG: polyprenyl synthetase [Sphingobacteriales bacterium 17-39-43]|jgi:octaprenyl-diphosphate synthase|uniref:polyprenyl synthetase family protein n=1 Tax=Daejeonella sp. TaxID=2805397 RepID=UPI000BDC0D31|nr:polyprenyl synthetase family protein [Daejeonella sp.]OYY02690.1 MAG: polyprenyl synthetase [Sphingobacteriia bacterium 35-40-5]OYZ31538.1 MAG: polyprenyl synthetase [Sphingobacteriales bacterium 16-39-50]OYZ46200.1 MAG: polyprenyl synthetase [Sphingobacteriales bacterium 24-40-4]OZA24656.1 MAG: polyprenyl synthetase [Sphingobacteriales bacterium 17-39-43]OZA62305.1 MAG: polyprenyl synthetase [Sphingobacteriales bacterium 39-40-5]
MLNLEEIKKPIAAELETFEAKFKASMQSSVPLLDRITHYIVKRKGKQIRPMFVFLSASLCGGITEATYRGAALVELLHTATLVHDDVVDNSYERRGFFSVNALWKNKIAVLVGDFLLSKGLLLSINNGDFGLLKIVSDAVKQMSEGELLQIEKARRLDIDEAVYYEVIRQKTASLIASCCSCGAASAGADAEIVEKMRLFGEKVGIAFQIKDDLFDFGTDDVGKPLGIDIKEKKITLPLIYALNKAGSSEKRRIINLVKNHNEESDKVSEVIDFVRNSGGLDYARSRMDAYQQEAFTILNDLPEHESRDSLQQLVRFTTERKK